MKTASIVFAIVVFMIAAWIFQHNAPWLLDQIKHLGWLGYLTFLVLYCLATLFMLPTMLLTLAGGALFGPFLGTFLNLAGASLGAAAAFCISRYTAQNWFASKVGPRTRQMILGVEKRGWQFVAVLRLLPIVPFNLVNYGLGITGIKFSHYIVTTIVFLAPAEIVYTWFGCFGMTALKNSQSFYSYGGLILSVLGGIILVGIIHMIYRQQEKQIIQNLVD